MAVSEREARKALFLQGFAAERAVAVPSLKRHCVDGRVKPGHDGEEV